MSLEMTLKEFENLNLFSNKNTESIVRSLVNKSSNAVLVSMYEDAMVLFDHEEGQFYAADYAFDPKKLTLKMENFDPVELIKEASDFREKVYEFFDDDEASSTELVEAYANDVIAQERYINDLIKESMITKDFSEVIDYSELKGVGEDISIKNERFFKKYTERLKTHPLTEVALFTWKGTVNVSLVETEEKKLLHGSAVENAKNLWKRTSFRENFEDAATTFIDDVEEGADKLKALLEEYPQIFFLDVADRKTLFGKAVMHSSSLREEMEDLMKGIDLMFEKFDLAEMKEEYMLEADEEEMEEPEEKPKKDKKDKEEKPAEELSSEEQAKIADELKKISEKIEDEGLKEKLDDVIAKLDKGKEEGTRPEVVKEAIYLLSM